MIDVWAMSMVCYLILILRQHPNDISSWKVLNTPHLKSHLLIDLSTLPSSLQSFGRKRRPRKPQRLPPRQALLVLLIFWLVLWLWLLLFVLPLLLLVRHCTHSCCTMLVCHVSHHLSYHLLEWQVHPSLLKTSVPSIKWILGCIRSCLKKVTRPRITFSMLQCRNWRRPDSGLVRSHHWRMLLLVGLFLWTSHMFSCRIVTLRLGLNWTRFWHSNFILYSVFLVAHIL